MQKIAKRIFSVFLILFIYVGGVSAADVAGATTSSSEVTTSSGSQGIFTKIHVDDTCSAAFKDSKIIEDSFVICKQDVGLNAFSMAIASVINKNDTAKGLYETFSVPVPAYSEVVNFISKPIGAVSAAAVDLCLVIVLMFSAYRLYLFGYRNMRDASIEQAFRDPNTYKAFAGFGLVALFAYRVGDLNVGQLVVIGSGLFAMKLTVYLFASLIAVFNFDVSDPDWDGVYSEFLPAGQEYGTGVVSAVYGAQEAAMRTNFSNVSIESANMIKEEGSDSDAWSFVSAIKAFFSSFSGSYDPRDPTAAEYFSGIFDDMSMQLTMMSPISTKVLGGRGGTYNSTTIVNSTAASNLSLADSRISSDTANMYTMPLFEKANEYDSLFSGNNIMSLGANLPTVPSEVYQTIARHNFMGVLQGLMISGDTVSTDESEASRLEAVGEQFSQLISEVVTQYPTVTPLQVIAIVQNYALGVIGVQAVRQSKGSTVTLLYPFIGRSQFDANYTGEDYDKVEPFNYVFSEALSAARELRRYSCIQNFEKTAQEMIMYTELSGDDFDVPMKSLVDSDVMPICLLPKENDITSYGYIGSQAMLEVAKNAAEEIKTGASDSANLEAVLLQQAVLARVTKLTESSTSPAQSEAGDALSRAQVHLDNIAAYYARMAAISRYAGIKSISSRNDEARFKLLSNMRQQGAVAVSSYFLQLSKEQEKYADIVYGANPQVNVKTNIDQGYNVPTPSSLWDTEESLIKKAALFVGDDVDFGAQLTSGNPDVTAQSLTGDDLATDEVSDVNMFASMVLDILIPNDDVLKKGFGLDQDKELLENFSACTTTVNCVEFRQHPIATLSIFGKDMVLTGLMIVLVDAIVQLLSKLANGEDLGGISGGDGKGIFSTLKKIGMKVANAITKIGPILKIAAVITAVFAVFGKVFIIAGIFIGYIVPMMPYVAQVMMWLGWFAEFLILFCVIPILIAFAFILKDDGQALFKPSSIISMITSVILRAPLIFLAFMVFYTLSYAAIYIVNSTLFTLFKFDTSEGFGLHAIMGALSAVVFFVFLVTMYFLIFKSLIKMMTEIPDYVLRPMGVDSLNVQVSAGIESFVAARTMQKLVTDSVDVGKAGAMSMLSKDNPEGNGGGNPPPNSPPPNSPPPAGGGAPAPENVLKVNDAGQAGAPMSAPSTATNGDHSGGQGGSAQAGVNKVDVRNPESVETKQTGKPKAGSDSTKIDNKAKAEQFDPMSSSSAPEERDDKK